MKVVVDARELEGQPTGVGRVLQGLLEAWPEGDVLRLVARSQPRFESLRAGWQIDLRRGPDGVPGSLWEQLVLPYATRGADVLLCPNYSMPRFAPCPTAVCMHDCAPFAIPGTFGPRERTRRRLGARIAARRAAFLFMGTEFAAQEAARHLGVEQSRLLVIPWGLTTGFGPVPEGRVAAARERYGIEGRSVLFVGSDLQRRDLDALASIVAELARERADLRLYVVGGSRRHAAGGAARYLGYVPEADLPALYATATVVAYPSSYEGFGLPVLEALACGTAVVASDAAALSEVYADRAWLAPHGDHDAWRHALATLLDSESERRRWTDTAQPWARAQRWRASAARLRTQLHASCRGSG